MKITLIKDPLFFNKKKITSTHYQPLNTFTHTQLTSYKLMKKKRNTLQFKTRRKANQNRLMLKHKEKLHTYRDTQ